MILLLGGSYSAVAAGAMIGGLVTAGIVYLLAYKNGVQGFRLIIVGIAISAMLASVNTWLILKADLARAMAAATWGAGSLNGLSWTQVLPVVLILAVLVPPLFLLGRRMNVLEMGDDAAQALGVRSERTRLSLVVVGSRSPRSSRPRPDPSRSSRSPRPSSPDGSRAARPSASLPRPPWAPRCSPRATSSRSARSRPRSSPWAS